MTVNRWDIAYVESLVARADGDMEALECLLALLIRVHRECLDARRQAEDAEFVRRTNLDTINANVPLTA